MTNVVRLTLGPVRGITISMDETDQNYISQMYQGSAVAGINNSIAYMLTNPPADLALWVRDTGQTLGFIPRQVQAQGVGFTGLAPILGIWKGFRNIAYVLLALIMIVVGFMVMFRQKIDPKTVVTVQNSLPRIVVVLLLITFSYAIVGLMIDLMYLVIAAGMAILDKSLPGGAKISIFGMGVDLISGGFGDLLGSVFAPIVNAPTQILTQTIGGALSRNPQAAQNALPGLLMFSAGLGPGIIIWLLVALFYLFALVRILIMLLMAYVNIILAVLVGPVQILFDALPGNNAFVSWLKNLFVNLIPFPITVFMLILGFSLSSNLGTTGSLWTPPLLPQWGVASSFASTILWLGIILTIPSIVNTVKEALKAKAAVPIGGGFGGVSGVFGTGMQLLSAGYYLKAMTTKSVPEKVMGTEPGKKR